MMYLAMQSVHGPWEAPDDSVARFSNSSVDASHFIADTKRQIYAGMLLELDYTVGNVTVALKRHGMWHNQTLFVLTSTSRPSVSVPHTSTSHPRGSELTLTVSEQHIRGLCLTTHNSALLPFPVAPRKLHAENPDLYSTLLLTSLLSLLPAR